MAWSLDVKTRCEQDADKTSHETPLSFASKVDTNLDAGWLDGMVLASHHDIHPTTNGLDPAAGHGLSCRDDHHLINRASEDAVIRDGSCLGSGGDGATPEATEEHGLVRQRSSTVALLLRVAVTVPPSLTRLLLLTVSDDGLRVGHTRAEFTPARR